MNAAQETADGRAMRRTAAVSVGAAILLVAVKLATGLATGSLAFIAEALHSGTDLVAALLTLFAVRVAVRPPDQEHHSGHGKAEHLAALKLHGPCPAHRRSFSPVVQPSLDWD